MITDIVGDTAGYLTHDAQPFLLHDYSLSLEQFTVGLGQGFLQVLLGGYVNENAADMVDLPLGGEKYPGLRADPDDPPGFFANPILPEISLVGFQSLHKLLFGRLQIFGQD